MSNCKQHLPEHQWNHVALVALDLVADGPEIGTPSLFVNVARSLFPRRCKCKPRETTLIKDDAVLIKRAEIASGRRACGITYHKNGSIKVKLGDGGKQAEEAEERARWREAINGWREAISREKANH
jgi:hypothetical protein